MLLIQYTLVFATVLALVALAGMFSERSGVINLGLEGTMVMGALGGALMMHYLPVNTNGFVVVFVSILGSLVFGLIYSMLLSVASVTFKADQTITGTAMNIMAPALATVIVKAITLKETGKASPKLDYIQFHNYFVFKIGKMEFNYFFILMIILVIIAWILLYKTKFGMRLMSCGENPQAADSVGINVTKYRYTGVAISGLLGGLGGFAFINSANSSWPFDSGVAGFGFLALAVMIFGQWKPIFICLGALLFGFFRTFGIVYTSYSWIEKLSINPIFYQMLPYIVCLIVLMFTSKKSRAPKAEGIPYNKSSR
ncbi:MAG TPA: sugar ABC transporter permease [Firmicutes bacterium]|nr:sugar ABC transporter permease [Bacillota bacterium]